MRPRASLIGLALSLPGVGCTEFEDGADTLEVVNGRSLDAPGAMALGADDVAGIAPTARAEWSCLDDPPVPAPVPSEVRRFTYTVGVTSYLPGVPLDNLSIRLCSAIDVACASPLEQDLRADLDGNIRFATFLGFEGYLEILADGHLPEVAYLRGPVTGDFVEPLPFQLFPELLVAQLGTANQIEVRRELALIAAQAFDCGGIRAAGVALRNDVGGVPYYFASGVPNVSATETDATGLGGMVNVPPGLLELRAQLDESGPEVTRRSINVRPGWLTFVALPAASGFSAP